MRISDWSSDVCSSDLRAGRGLDPGIFKGWRYWDGWIDDARMVIALLRDAEARGATLFPRIAATHAERAGGGWRITLSDERTVEARHLANATGPCAEIGRAPCRERVCQYV